MTAFPIATFAGAQIGSARTDLAGTQQNFTVSFDNGGDATGYVPFIDLVVPAGVTFDAGSAIYLGQPVSTTVLTFGASGTLTHPFAVNAAGQPLVVSGAPGSQLVVLTLPFGSFAPGQTRADVNFTGTVSSGTSQIGVPQTLVATGGFGWNTNPLSNAGGAIVQPGFGSAAGDAATLAVTPALFTVSSTYRGPQNELATGASLPDVYGGAPPASAERFDITSAIAPGASLANFTLSDPLPASVVATDFQVIVGGQTYFYTVDPATGALTPAAVNPAGAPAVAWNAATNTITVNFGTVTGVSGQPGPEIKAFFTVPLAQGLGTANAVSVASQDLVVTDMLPFGAVAQTFQLTDTNGAVYSYTYTPGVAGAAGTITPVSGNPTNAPAQLAAAGEAGQRWFYYDAAAGKIVADFGVATVNGETASISAQWSGGQYQPQPGVVSSTAGADASNFQVVDQLNGGATATDFTVDIGGVTSAYHYDAASATLTQTSGSGPVAASAPGASGMSWVSYDAANHRIIVNVAAVAAGETVSVNSQFSGGQTVDQTTGARYALTNSASASASLANAAAGSAPLTATSGESDVSATAITLQKHVAATDPSGAAVGANSIVPGDHLAWTFDAQVSNYFDLANLNISDTFSDGQHIDPTVPVTLNLAELGTGFGPVALTAADETVTNNTDGSTTIVFNVSQALQRAGDANGIMSGGAGLADASPSVANATTLALSFATIVDQAYKVAKPNSAVLVEGDSVSNIGTITANIVGAGGTITPTPVSDVSTVGVALPVGAVSKTVFAITRDGAVIWRADQTTVTPMPLVQTGDAVTYRLAYNLPETHAADLTLTDYLPLPVFNATDPTASGTATPYTFDATHMVSLNGMAPLPAAGVVAYDSNDTAHIYAANPNPTPVVSASSNALSLDFGAINGVSSTSQTYQNSNIDVLFTTTVTDAAFGDGLLLTNQVHSDELNSFGVDSTGNAIVQIQLAAPALTIEKAVVATTDSHGVFRNANGSVIAGTGAISLGGVMWSLGGSNAPFAGTITTAGLAASPVADTLTNIGGGETSRYALVVENTGHDSNGAFDVNLHDTAIPAGETLVPGSVQVFDGAGHALSFTDANPSVDLFSATGVTIQDNSGLTGQALGPNGSMAAAGSNVFVVTYELATIAAVQTPDLTLPDTATITGFSEKSGGVNRVGTEPASSTNASSAIVTAPPTLAKSVIATGEQPNGSDSAHLKIGETVTYQIVATLPGGTAANLDIKDVLPSSMTLMSASIASIGNDISGGNIGIGAGEVAAGSVSSTGAFNFGNVMVANDTRNAADQIVLDVTAFVSPTANVADQQHVTNTADLIETKPTGGTYTLAATAPVIVATPVLAFTKQVEDLTTGTAFAAHVATHAGDTLEYSLTLANTGSGNAYQVQISDLLNELGIGTDTAGNSNLSFVSGSVVASGGASVVNSGAGFAATLAELAAGATATVTFRAVVSTHAAFNASITNTAGYTADTLPGTDGNFAATGVVSGTATAVATLASPSSTKAFVQGSDSTIAGSNLAVGETGIYVITATLPAGDSTDLQIVDTLPTDANGTALLAYVANSASLSSVSAGVTLAAAPVVHVAGNSVTVDMGAVHSTGGSVAVTLGATLSNTALLPASNTITNTESIVSGGTVLSTGTASVGVVSPDFTIMKSESVASGQAGDIITYALTIEPAAGDVVPAYNLAITDAIQPGLTLISGSERITGGDAGAVNTATDTPTAITVTSSKLLASDAPLVVTYQAALSNNDINGQVVQNTGTLSYASQPTGGASVVPTQSNTVSATVALADQFAKTLAGTSDGPAIVTASGQPGASPTEQVTFDLTATLGHGAQNATITDTLPAGLSYVSSTVVSLGGVTGSALAVGQSGSYAGGTLSFALGDVVNPAGSSSSNVVVSVTATVNASDALTTLAASDVITNVGTLTATNPTASPYVSANPLNQTLTSSASVLVVPGGTIEGRAFVNDACDGLYHIGDAAVGGITVKLLDAAGNTVQTTSTDQNGNYSFKVAAPQAYTEQFVLPSGLSFTEKGAGGTADAGINSAVNPGTGQTDSFTVPGNNGVIVENAGLYLNGNFAGQTPTQIGANATVSYNTGGQIVVGTGNDNVHTNAGNNVILLGSSGSTGGDVVETGPGNDIVYACGTGGTNAQALGTSDYIFGGSGSGVLQGGSGADYLMAGPGNYTLAGGAGPSTLVAGPSNSTVTTDANANPLSFTVGDEIRPGGGDATILYQKGDGVDLLDTFTPGHDTLTIYGYAASDARLVRNVSGHTMLYLGGNDAIVFNDVYAGQNADGSYPGISFVPTIPAAPQLVLRFDANGMPYFTAPVAMPSLGAALPTLSSATDTGIITGTAAFQRLVAGNGANFTLVGGPSNNVLVGGTGSDVLVGTGASNTLSGGDGNNALFASGDGNVVTAGNGTNIVVLTNTTNTSVTLGTGANAVFAFGAGSGDDLEIGVGSTTGSANTVFAAIDNVTIHVGTGNLFLFGTGDHVTVDHPTGGVLLVSGSGATTNAGNGDLLLFQSGGSVDVGTGSHQLYVTGTGVSITAQGSNVIVGPAGNASIDVTGSGTQTIGLGGSGNTISVADGDATIFAGQSGDTISTGAGTDTILMGQGDTLHAGSGSNTVWLAPGGGDSVGLAAQSVANDLYGFTLGNGDVLDISAVLAAAHADLTQVQNYVHVSQSGGDTLVGFNATGTAGGAFATIADLHGLSTSYAALGTQLKVA